MPHSYTDAIWYQCIVCDTENDLGRIESYKNEADIILQFEFICFIVTLYVIVTALLPINSSLWKMIIQNLVLSKYEMN